MVIKAKKNSKGENGVRREGEKRGIGREGVERERGGSVLEGRGKVPLRTCFKEDLQEERNQVLDVFEGKGCSRQQWLLYKGRIQMSSSCVCSRRKSSVGGNTEGGRTSHRETGSTRGPPSL